MVGRRRESGFDSGEKGVVRGRPAAALRSCPDSVSHVPPGDALHLDREEKSSVLAALQIPPSAHCPAPSPGTRYRPAPGAPWEL